MKRNKKNENKNRKNYGKRSLFIRKNKDRDLENMLQPDSSGAVSKEYFNLPKS